MIVLARAALRELAPLVRGPAGTAKQTRLYGAVLMFWRIQTILKHSKDPINGTFGRNSVQMEVGLTHRARGGPNRLWTMYYLFVYNQELYFLIFGNEIDLTR
jgi:hypothetical protein